MKEPSISVLINTRNEEANIRLCLESAGPADEIIVVDMESEDRTVEIAREYTNKVYSHEKLGYADPARAFALSKATGDWVLILDADELATPGLWKAIREIASKDRADVAIIPFRTWMFGRELLGGGWGPGQDTHPRFFRRATNILSERVHLMFEIPPEARIERITDLGACIVHFNYLDLEHFLEKSNRYTTIEAQNAYEGKKAGLPHFRDALAKAVKEFTRRYLVKKGYRDGSTGFLLAFLQAGYYLSAWHKEDTMRRYGRLEARSAITASYETEKRRIVAEAERE
ncbi:MAG TPA: glycosyltransferase family 2 protein [Rectinemataceae bacterium]|nr:glycosyltransferase family 2 protein [Rectinemataceae bacterium]